LDDDGQYRNGWLICTRGKSFAVYAATATEKQVCDLIAKVLFPRNAIFASHGIDQRHATQLGLILNLVAWCCTIR
jgi:hypothetical protein